VENLSVAQSPERVTELEGLLAAERAAAADLAAAETAEDVEQNAALAEARSATDALIAEIKEMNKQLNIAPSIKLYEGGIIDEKEFNDKLATVAELAVGDACTGSNPRSINPEQMAKLLTCCFYDTEVDF
jgi:alcohol dehydrogenase class IV